MDGHGGYFAEHADADDDGGEVGSASDGHDPGAGEELARLIAEAGAVEAAAVLEEGFMGIVQAVDHLVRETQIVFVRFAFAVRVVGIGGGGSFFHLDRFDLRARFVEDVGPFGPEFLDGGGRLGWAMLGVFPQVCGGGDVGDGRLDVFGVEAAAVECQEGEEEEEGDGEEEEARGQAGEHVSKAARGTTGALMSEGMVMVRRGRMERRWMRGVPSISICLNRVLGCFLAEADGVVCRRSTRRILDTTTTPPLRPPIISRITAISEPLPGEDPRTAER